MSDRLLVSTRKGLIEVRRNGGGWGHAKAHFLGSPVSAALKDARDGTLYAALDLGHFGVKLHRSDDDGASWTEVAVPSYEGVGEGEDAPSLKLIWCLEPGGADQPGVLWAGTLPGGLFRSEDRGESWTLIRSLWDDPRREQWFGGGYDQPGIHSISVDPRNSSAVSVAVSCDGVWETRDGGQTWTLGGQGMRAKYLPPEQAGDPTTQDPHRMVRCKAAPDSYWVQHHNGVFRSRSGIDGWEELKVPPSSFGFAVAVHPDDPDCAWFVPAVKDEFRYPVDQKLVVTRTRDGGQSFEVLSEGLPQDASYDLVYRHGLEIDATGERLAMGSTTGGLWVTENGGEAWSGLPARLPPIYAVRFA
ncbi:WD40/YVTN/BNR-like repeat-containing protein [Phenylobacterium terrae]|uniref:WD40/YVTN/BNR-like repeat-containing protein n=1 Tax=Phenylobacterium terrae TaxID=2665495 RepID=A0ABW4N522_9CAUL